MQETRRSSGSSSSRRISLKMRRPDGTDVSLAVADFGRSLAGETARTGRASLAGRGTAKVAGFDPELDNVRTPSPRTPPGPGPPAQAAPKGSLPRGGAPCDPAGRGSHLHLRQVAPHHDDPLMMLASFPLKLKSGAVTAVLNLASALASGCPVSCF